MTTTRRRSTGTTRRKASAASVPSPNPPAPVRLTKVRAALQRIASGYYDRDEVRTRLASAVLAELRKD